MTKIPKKLVEGSLLRVVAPARSLPMIAEADQLIAEQKLQSLGLRLDFGANVSEVQAFVSASIKSRVADLEAAFLDPNVDGILSVIGGYNSNQIIAHLNYDLIAANPKTLCGYSDITALQNAIYARTGLVVYSGPHYSTFAMKLGLEFTLENFQRCLFQDAPFQVPVSEKWSDDAHYRDQDNRIFKENPGLVIHSYGKAEGRLIGGNLCTFILLLGTSFRPSFKDAILFIEKDSSFGTATPMFFDRHLQALIHQPDFKEVRGLVIGRFQSQSGMTPEMLHQIVKSKPELNSIPVVSGFDFGHTKPHLTLPIGGRARLEADEQASLTLLTH